VLLGFEQGLEFRETGVAIELIRRAGVASCRSGDPPPRRVQPRTTRRTIRARMYSRLAVSASNANNFAGGEFRDPGVELRVGGDWRRTGVAPPRSSAPASSRPCAAGVAGAALAAPAGAGAADAPPADLGRAFARAAVQLLRRGARTPAGRTVYPQRPGIRRLTLQPVERRRQRHVGPDRRELAREFQRAQPGAQVLADLAFDVGRIRDDPIERRILAEPLRRRPGPDLVDALERLASCRRPARGNRTTCSGNTSSFAFDALRGRGPSPTSC
jgi:hypothetical protein